MKKDESDLVTGIFFHHYKKKLPHISFSLLLAGILSAGKKHIFGNLDVMLVCLMLSGENISCPT